MFARRVDFALLLELYSTNINFEFNTYCIYV